MKSDQSKQEPEEIGKSKQESEEIGQSEKEIEKVLNVNEEPGSDVPDFISKRDVGLINFDINTENLFCQIGWEQKLPSLVQNIFRTVMGLFYPKIIVQWSVTGSRGN